jgi:hypothetical protein
MNLRSLISSLLLLAAGAVPAAGGSICIEATPAADATSASVALAITITDDGELPGCTAFGIRRRATYPCGDWEDVTCIARENGIRTVPFVDSDVARNTTYQYEAFGYAVVPGSCAVPLADQYAFQSAFPCNGQFPFEILEFVTVGPDPTPVFHGRLASVEEDPVISWIVASNCGNSCFPGLGGRGDASVNAYADTGIDVLVYGWVEWCGNGCGYVLHATAAAPRECPPIAVDARTWTHVKRLYE